MISREKLDKRLADHRVKEEKKKREKKKQGFSADHRARLSTAKIIRDAKAQIRDNLELHPAQKKIEKALEPPLSGAVVMVIAGRRFGKTVFAVKKIVDRAVEIPGARIWYIAPTEKQAYRIAWRILLHPRREDGILKPPLLPSALVKKKREDQHWVELNNGSLIEFVGTQEDIFLLGAYLHFVVLDEFPTMSYSLWTDTIRPMLGDFNGDALFIGTVPDPKRHAITLEYLEMYEKLLFTKSKSTKNRDRAFNFTSFDNPHINHEKFKQDIKDLAKKGRKKDAERLYYGKYTREYGLIFPRFHYDKHTVEPFKVPGNWLRAQSLDPHPHKPYYGLWVAIDQRNHLWIYREKEFVDDEARPRTPHEVAYDTLYVEALAKEKIKKRLIDPTYAKVKQAVLARGQSKDQLSVLDLLREGGLHYEIGKRDDPAFIDRLRDMLVDVPEPTIHIFRSCPNLIRQIENAMWDAYASPKAREEKGAKDKRKAVDDDFLSCLKYIINARLRYIDANKLSAFRDVLQQRWQAGDFM